MGQFRGTRFLITTLLLITLGAGTAIVLYAEKLSHYDIRTDVQGKILPAYSADPGTAYDHNLRLIWDFWKNMKSCPNGVKYYLQHQVWAHPKEDARGLGGDQLMMALSSWNLLHAYLGDPSIVENMEYIANYYLDHGLSPSNAVWPNLPFPYNTELHSGVYDGDMRAGKGYLQPDKAGSFGHELVVLYKITGKERYLKGALAIADTLAAKVVPGDSDNSPWPFRVQALSGEVKGAYTANWTSTLMMLDELLGLRQGNGPAYQKSRDLLTAWLKRYPMRMNKWGPFFEDIGEWSDTEINADTMAWYILEHPGWSEDWREEVKSILDWTRASFSNPRWIQYGVQPINEQTAYRVPGNSHTSRHCSVELIFAEKTGDSKYKDASIRGLNWATYMVGEHGDNCYAYDDVWLTDGYGDYVRHYLRSMAAFPELAPRNQNHLLGSSSIIRRVQYGANSVTYTSFDASSREVLRLSFQPLGIMAGKTSLKRLSEAAELDQRQGYTFEAPGDPDGCLRIRHDNSGEILISAKPVNQAPVAKSREVRVDQGLPRKIDLEASTQGAPAKGPLHYTIYGPFHGKLSGTAPHLEYLPDTDFTGNDVFTFCMNNGELESNVAQVTLLIDRPNLGQSRDAKPFVMDDTQAVAGMKPLPALTDRDLTTSVEASNRDPHLREVAVGIIWPKAMSFRQVVFQQGMANDHGHGSFNGRIRLQVSADGLQWKDASPVSLTPAYWGGKGVSLGDYTFTVPEILSCRGVRVLGQLGKSSQGNSTILRVRELQVLPNLSRSQDIPGELTWREEYVAPPRIVRQGDIAQFAARLEGPGLKGYQWQRSTDQGKTWKDLPGANSSFWSFRVTSMEEFQGNQFRCIIFYGLGQQKITKPVPLTVVSPSEELSQTSNSPLE
jgi:hypothetical protein